MQCLCSWCGARISDEPGEGGRTSYDVCPACTVKLAGDEGLSIQSIIDRFPFPILVVDDDVKVSVLNRRGQEILGVLPGQGAQRRGGELFGCVNSHLPGGCGKTIHCSACALRRAVVATYRTGTPQPHVPATMKWGDADVALTFATSMRGEAVLVKIDSTDW